MKKYLLPHTGQYYKANLHCHTTISDGKLTPEQIKEAYRAKGYSIIAYTDHDIMIPHDDLNDENFLALHAYEMEVNQPGSPKHRKTCHMCLIALDPDNLTQVCWHREKYLIHNAINYRDQAKFDPALPDYEREYTHACVNDMMKIARENGFFVTYNHPGWSKEGYPEYSGYTGMHAMEICNYGCYHNGFNDYNPKIYDTLLQMGQRIYCLATDDNHNPVPVDDGASDSFGGYVMIKADKLEYKTITDALLAGNFYASMGPEIKDLWYEDGKICVSTSAADRITMNTGTRKVRRIFRQKGKTLKYAEFPLMDEDIYIRITVTDKYGRHADTNAYFCDELRAEVQA